jgi:hypothetical protein
MDSCRSVTRQTKRWRVIAGCLACGLGGLVLGATGQPRPSATVIGVSGGDSYIYRVWSDGAVDRLDVRGQVKTARGIATWGRIKIDTQLKQVDQILE